MREATRGEREEEGRKRMNDQGREERRSIKGLKLFSCGGHHFP